MIDPLDTLKKMLTLEQRDYEYQDKAVAGGLARYADTWITQARKIYGSQAQAWIEEVANRLRAYSSLQPEARKEALRVLREVLEAPPEGGDSLVEPELKVEPSIYRASRPAYAPEPGKGVLASVRTLSGVGKKRSALLEKLGVQTIRDLLFLYPRRYEDYSTLKTIDQLEYGERVSIIASVWEAGGRRTRGGQHIFRAILSDATGTLEVTWFNQPYLEGRIKPGMQIAASGKVDEYLGRLTMNAPDWEPVGRKDLENVRIIPVYPLTEGLTQRWMRLLIKRALHAWAQRMGDPLPLSLREQHRLLPLDRALWGTHFPEDQEHLREARRRLAFEEALYLQLGLLRQKQQWKSEPGRTIRPDPEYLEGLLASLPYLLTEAQRRSLEEMLSDMASGEPMNRLLQGDVGSGKTVVAAVLMAIVAQGGYQAALMAPTEILAEQHYESLRRLFESFPAPHLNVRLLTGSVQGEEREAIYAGLADGSIQVAVGTHALIQETVTFDKLALVVIDEQHRFGVEQRGALRQKGYNPHLLVMTATPIPRSLELTVWGHLDVSTLDEMPPGRRPVETRLLTHRERERAYAFIRTQIEKGRQAFIIYPLVEESDKIEARAAVDEYERLQKDVFPDLRLGLLHGQLRSEDKERTMAAFALGDLDILVATSVVEVGIDIPNASVMLIEGAERFGLSQLHQFRGRVGRGAHQSYCLLLPESVSEDAAERLKAVEDTTDGFVLAEKDLAMRGPGEFLGTRQSGMPELPMATLVDTRLLREVRSAADTILSQDPDLGASEHRGLARRVAEFWDTAGDLS
ncbi:MAG: ATP-dependent DNA helicase RecG [Anaerolineae bacterium]